MSCCDKPGSRPASTQTQPAVTPCPACPDMEIEINDTPATDDDLVLLKCDHPAHRSVTRCRIRAVNCSGGASATVVLVNPDGRLRFPNDGDTTKTLSLPSDGSWVSFEISGETGSNAIGDAVIEARCQSASGAVKATARITVVWFDQATIAISTPGTYSFTGGQVTATGGPAVQYSAQARIRPAGVSCTAPQTNDLRIGISQNLNSTTRVITWGSPTPTWSGSAPAGTTAVVPTTIVSTLRLTSRLNDSETSVAPLYDQPGKPTTIDGNSLQRATGCAGSAPATSSDTPSHGSGPLSLPMQDTAGTNVGTVAYSVANVTINDSFVTWVVIFNTATNELCALRERPWSVSINGTGGGGQKATVSGDSAPTMDPVTVPPFPNDAGQDPANSTFTTSGTTTLTKP